MSNDSLINKVYCHLFNGTMRNNLNQIVLNVCVFTFKDVNNYIKITRLTFKLVIENISITFYSTYQYLWHFKNVQKWIGLSANHVLHVGECAGSGNL